VAKARTGRHAERAHEDSSSATQPSNGWSSNPIGKAA